MCGKSLKLLGKTKEHRGKKGQLMSAMTKERSVGQSPARRRYIYKTGLCEGTHVMTLDGNLPVEYLCRGDMIITREGSRPLRRISAKALKDCPILVKSGALGPGRPVHDMYLAPDQMVHQRDWCRGGRFGSDLAAIPLSRLVDGDAIQWAEHPGELLVYNLEFTSQQVIYTEGLEVMSIAPALSLVRGIAVA